MFGPKRGSVSEIRSPKHCHVFQYNKIPDGLLLTPTKTIGGGNSFSYSHSVTRMLWGEKVEEEEREQGIPFDFDFLSLISAPKDYYKILEVDYDATDETIRSNYIRLALKWHPDKRKNEESATTKFQEISEAYQVLSDPVKREEYDRNGLPQFQDYMMEYIHHFKGLILTCNGLGIRHSICYHYFAVDGISHWIDQCEEFCGDQGLGFLGSAIYDKLGPMIEELGQMH